MTLNNPFSWDLEPENNNKAMEERQANLYVLDTMFFECFNTTAGKAVLAHYRKNTIEAATWMPSLDYNKAIAHGFAREGQNALVRDTEQRIERGRTAKHKPQRSKKP